MRNFFHFILLFLLSSIACGGVYQWTDENGQVHFGSVPPHQQKEYAVGDKIMPAVKKTIQVDPKKKVVDTDKPDTVKKDAAESDKAPKATARKVSIKKLEALILNLRSDARKASAENKKGHVQKTESNEIPTTRSTEIGKPVTTTVLTTKSSQEEVANSEVGPTDEKSIEKENSAHLSEFESAESGGIKESVATNPAVNEKQKVNVKDEDKCGLFMGFVEQYEIKKQEGCPGPHCEVFTRQLKKFTLKEKRYCASVR